MRLIEEHTVKGFYPKGNTFKNNANPLVGGLSASDISNIIGEERISYPKDSLID